MSSPGKGLFAKYDRQVWLLSGGAFINSLGFSIAYPFVSLYLYKYQGIPMGTIGLALLLAATIAAVAQIGAGELCDRYGRKVIMSIGLFLQMTAFAFLGLAIMLNMDFNTIVVLLILRQIAGSLFSNVPMIMIADIVEPYNRSGAYSLLRVGMNLGFAIGPVLGGFIAAFSYPLMFFLTAVTSGAYMLGSVFILRDTKPDKTETTSEKKNGHIWADKTFIVFCVFSAVVSLVYSQMMTTYSTYSGSFVGLPESFIGFLFSLNGFMIVFLQYPITRFLDRYKLTSSLITGALLYAIGFAAVGISGGFWSLFACMFIITIGEMVFSPPSMSIVSQMASSGSRGRYMNLSMVLTGFGWSLGPLIGGALMDAYKDNIVIMWAAVGLLGIVGMLGFVWLRLFIRKDIDSPGFEEKPLPVAVKVAVRR